MAGEIHHAIQGTGTNEKKLIEILCPCNNDEIRQINAAYDQLYRKSMESAVKSDLSGEFKHLMVAIMQVRYSLIIEDQNYNDNDSLFTDFLFDIDRERGTIMNSTSTKSWLLKTPKHFSSRVMKLKRG